MEIDSNKWFTKKSEPEINDLVILRDHDLPPSKWLLGRIVEKHPGKDLISRVVTIKTKIGMCPCDKLCVYCLQLVKLEFSFDIFVLFILHFF